MRRRYGRPSVRAPTDDEIADATHAVPPERHPLWWVALIGSFAFVVGAVGYAIGVRSSESDDQLSAVDVGFLQDMFDHHDQAIRLSLLELADGSDATARHFAQEVIIFQRREIGIMEQLLDQGGHGRGGTDRLVMTWMGEPTPLRQMPGLATEAQLDALETASGADADRLFLQLMRAHHEGGIHMAQFAASSGSNQRVRDLAARMAEYQRIEVNEYDQLMQRLGFA
jgi:uncharacterized protein (DUF305 family)